MGKYIDIETVDDTITTIANCILGNMEVKESVQDSLIKLNQTVIGDEAYGQVGLIKKVDEHTTYIEKDKEFKSRLVGGGLVLSFIWGLVLKFWKI